MRVFLLILQHSLTTSVIANVSAPMKRKTLSALERLPIQTQLFITYQRIRPIH